MWPVSLRIDRGTVGLSQLRARAILRFFGIRYAHSTYSDYQTAPSGAPVGIIESCWLYTRRHAWGFGRVDDIAIAAYIAGEERRAIKERVKAGLRRAKEAGKVLGQPMKQLDPALLLRLRREGLSLRQVARALDCSKSTIERRVRNDPSLKKSFGIQP